MRLLHGGALFMKQLYDADYIIRKNNEYEEQIIYNSPVEQKLMRMIEEATKACAIQKEKCRLQKEKLEAKRREREKRFLENQNAMEM